MCSMPIDSRTMSSETPARASSSAFNWRWVVLAGWQARDLASPMLTSRTTSFKASMKRAPAALPPWMPKDRIAAGRPQVAPGQGVLGVVGEAGVFHPGHLRMLLQVAGYGEGVVAVALHAQRQGLQALEDEEGVERRERRAHVAQRYHPAAADEGGGSEGLGEVTPW